MNGTAPLPPTPFGSSLSRTPRNAIPETEQGFSLIEALVALLILGVAAAGLVRAVESHIDSIARLESRAAAVWVAENRLTELAIGDTAGAAGAGTVDMLGRRWQVRTMIRTSPDPDLSRIDVAVGPPGAAPMVTLGGFVDRGPKIAPVPAA
ncbi:type II secretion system minor pseudopilin GspI [Sphingomonas arantia]|uniref:Type II secretion system protein I n=1 Tax=Sphingomonas arantia TaxID=1460676 RepID=A0ABW4TWU1_9SPHN